MKDDGKWKHSHDPDVWEDRADRWDKRAEISSEIWNKEYAESSRIQAQRLRDGHACRLCEFLGKCEKCNVVGSCTK